MKEWLFYLAFLGLILFPIKDEPLKKRALILFDKKAVINSLSLLNSFTQLGAFSLLRKGKNKNLSKNCKEGEFYSTDPMNGDQVCIKLPSDIMIKEMGSGNKAYTCRIGHSKISFSEDRLYDSGGYPAKSDTFRCREGIAFIEQGSFASTIHCVSEEPIFSPNMGGLISEFEEKMIVCNPSRTRILPFRPSYLCREDEWLNQDYCEPHTLCGPSEQEVKKPTKTTDRVCRPIAEDVFCDPDFEFKFKGVCRRTTECMDDEVEVKRPSPTSDRVCRKSN